ncbi:hypothetical protein KC360_g846 [Hortaea werneckii]|nr:hypothetical protein KC361_g1183 [Hortaea werneckii]KAI6888579.1 hypothetical protein KC325_g1186 [Hortaea werneckii]KAI6999768.1 hypothetical protein KC359_g1576 [Hortaea werneckii]KAI7149689.1 hypothetical protein KC344_g739 [Hortaea werneckii]KAI7179439.1 hypothetical protein KC360_g846 [Hortaea werneckii]
MDNQIPLSVPRRPPPSQRTVSSGALSQLEPPSRPGLPSRLSNVRSVSQPSKLADLTTEGDPERGNDGPPMLGVQERETGVLVERGQEGQEGEEERPAKRLKTGREVGHSEKINNEDVAKAGIRHEGEALPRLPTSGAPKTQMKLPGRGQRGGESSARASNGLEPPPIATRLPPPKTAADFAPWTGNHPEDQLNEAIIKSGYSDKGAGTGQSESNSAKPAIWQNLSSKNNMGLQTLSYLFTQVMEKRQALGKCTAPSTFKPPPRVTVTDTKREAWLRDLANPEIPLRKQSRTIPHGIRGKLLMEQCLSKAIPMQRAVWLAKCVGANELRAFKRRGVSGAAAATGEMKWIREWTAHVEQFLEGVVAMCGQQDWQTKINYAVKLSATFYSEKLLDTEHFLEWVASSFIEASIDTLPVWVIMAQIFWKDITRLCKRGRRLARNILERLSHLSQLPSDASRSLKARLQKFLAVLATVNKRCLIMPRNWVTHGELLISSLELEQTPGDVIESIIKRNERLARPLAIPANNAASPLLDLYTTLDSTSLEVDVTALARMCKSKIPETAVLLSALFDWATSPYRHGSKRRYLAAGIINALDDSGDDSTSLALRHLEANKSWTTDRINDSYLLIAELVRLGSFAVGRYMQWLSSSGALYAGNQAKTITGLLFCLPTDSLPAHLVGLRSALLDRIEVQREAEAKGTELVDLFEHALQTSALCNELEDAITTSTLSARLRVVQHARTSMDRIAGGESEVSVDTFCLLRTALEAAPDVAALSKLADISLATDSPALLATITDTVAMHMDAFAALGELQRLVNELIERYAALRTQQPLDRTLILALTRLVRPLLHRQGLEELLLSDLAICEQQSSMQVCSPASDSIIGMHASALDTDSDIDAVFASGNSMDDNLLHRVFDRVVQRAQKPQHEFFGSTSKLHGWLSQLRLVGGSSFDQLVHNYITSTFKDCNEESAHAAAAVTALVVSGCSSLQSIAEAGRTSSTAKAACLALDIILRIRPVPLSLHSTEKYRFTAEAEQYLHTAAHSLVELLCKACHDPNFAAEDSRILDVLVNYSVKHKERARSISKHAEQTATGLSNFGRMTRALLLRGSPQLSGDSMNMQTVISLANPLSVQFVVGTLEYLAKKGDAEGSDAEAAVKDNLIEAIEDGSEVWSLLLDAVSKPVQRTLHNWAREQLLLVASSGVESSEPEAFDAQTRRIVGRYLDVLSATKCSTAGIDNAATWSILAEKLSKVDTRLRSLDILASSQQLIRQALCETLEIILSIIVLGVETSEEDAEAEKQARASLLQSLCSLGTQSLAYTCPSSAEYAMDVAALITDNLAMDILQNVAHSMSTERALNVHIEGIVGKGSASAENWLALAFSPSSGTQQQRALAKHANHQGGAAGARPGGLNHATGSSHQQRAWSLPFGATRQPVEMKTTPYAIRRWEIMPDSAPVMGENDTSLSLGLFGARKA